MYINYIFHRERAYVCVQISFGFVLFHFIAQFNVCTDLNENKFHAHTIKQLICPMKGMGIRDRERERQRVKIRLILIMRS